MIPFSMSVASRVFCRGKPSFGSAIRNALFTSRFPCLGHLEEKEVVHRHAVLEKVVLERLSKIRFNIYDITGLQFFLEVLGNLLGIPEPQLVFRLVRELASHGNRAEKHHHEERGDVGGHRPIGSAASHPLG